MSTKHTDLSASKQVKESEDFGGALSVAKVTLDENGEEIKVEDLVGSAKRDAEIERLKEFHECEEELVREFEYVPLQLLY